MKPEKIVFVDDSLEKSFNELNSEDSIKKGLTKAIRELTDDAFCGRNVKKNLIPK